MPKRFIKASIMRTASALPRSFNNCKTVCMSFPALIKAGGESAWAKIAEESAVSCFRFSFAFSAK